MEIEAPLEKLGLSEKEAKIYTTLHRSEPMTATELSKRTGINRRSVYDAIDSLSSQGLINYTITNKKKIFSANALSALKTQLDEKKQLLESLMLHLSKFPTTNKGEPIIKIYSGKNSIKTVLEELIETQDTLHIYGGAMQIKELLQFYYPHWTKRREEKKILIKGIFIDLPKIRALLKTLKHITYKFIEKDYLSPAVWWLKGNKIYLVFFQENPTIISIESASLAKTYKHSFEILWKKV